MEGKAILSVQDAGFSYPGRTALESIRFEVGSGETFALLGPNGSGKTTLFRILATLLPVQKGHIRIGECCLVNDPAGVRSQIGVVFQAPSLDKKLKVIENLRYQGMLYGLSGRELADRVSRALERLRISDRAQDPVERLSGGLQRRVEIAKSLLHKPRLLILDEPSTGLDPRARRELWETLAELNRSEGMTLLVTTHLMEEADLCGRVMILDRGRIVALDTPGALRRNVSSEVITLRGDDLEGLNAEIRTKLSLTGQVRAGTLRVETRPGAEDRLIRQDLQRILETFGSRVHSVTLSRATLEDVFMKMTGRSFESGEGAE
ncbi:MAG: ABC transporter ATP-binding protein [Verrucomicrobiae bacterium]|nr:ABC transporter ATP-binding protein [Verrucomicrobiae bacterium]